MTHIDGIKRQSLNNDMNYLAILKMTCLSLFVIIYSYIHYALLKRAIYKKQYEIAILMRFFSRFVDLMNVWGYYLFISIIISLIFATFQCDLSFLVLPCGLLIAYFSLFYIIYHLLRAIISITNYHYHFSKYVLYLRSFKDDMSIYNQRYVTAIQKYTNLKILGIGNPSMLHHDTAFTDFISNDNANLSVVFRTERTWKNTIAKLMKRSQFILVKVDSTDGVMYEINYALTHYLNKVIFLIEENKDIDVFNKQTNNTFDGLKNCSLPLLAFWAEGKIRTSPIQNIGMSLQYCFNQMGKSISSRLYNVDAENLYWKAWDIYISSRFDAPAYDYRKRKVCILLWRSYCNGCEKAVALLKTILTEYPELKNTWSDNLFQ